MRQAFDMIELRLSRGEAGADQLSECFHDETEDAAYHYGFARGMQSALGIVRREIDDHTCGGIEE